MWLKTIEYEPVTLGEVPVAGTVEEERLRVPKGGGNRDVQFVRDVQGTEPDLVQPGLVQLSARVEVRDLQCAAVSPLVLEADRVCLDHEVPEERVGFITLAVVLVSWSTDMVEVPLPNPVQLAVRHPVGLDELPELDEQIPGKGLVPAEVLRLGDEVQQAFGIGSRQVRHGPQRYDE